MDGVDLGRASSKTFGRLTGTRLSGHLLTFKDAGFRLRVDLFRRCEGREKATVRWRVSTSGQLVSRKGTGELGVNHEYAGILARR